MKTKFKVGDKVRIVDNLTCYGLKIGSIVTIFYAEPKYDYYQEKGGWGFGGEDAEMFLKITQNQQIRKHLEAGKSITPIEALDMFGCLSLAQRIMNLRDQGMNIKTDMITTGTGKRIGKYSLIKE